tara:strand:+ start:1288 stop:2109 length:822 start_codon:yes stop_codon:yes gene_type:complete
VVFAISTQTAGDLKNHIHALMPSWKGTVLENFKYLSGGYSNDNYSFTKRFGEVCDNFVLRLPKVQQPFVNRDLESRWYQVLPDSVGVKPVALDVKSGAMITPMLDGRILAEVYLDNFAEQDLLDYVKDLHLLLPSIEREYNMFELAALYAVDTSALPRRDSMQLYQACHNDLNPWNIIVTEQGWRTIDWEFVGLNDPLFDLVALHQGLELPASGLLDLSFQLIGYADPSRLLRVQKTFWYREWAWADFQMRAGNMRAEIVAQHQLSQAKLAQL